ncbi:nucleoside triphosphate pyrophosphatase [Thiomicrorhabdus sp. 6S3-12]|uniref:Maf family protein n=1 Tax=Thiomicrorhabdus sp. 6S3-12 TaxID=2819681 RepID=UPI001AAC4AD2|nr:Maf family nucleotide pyrophosphatase [Thiomicrorhabdus sp. 6S3-12]MBO1924201.1 septum formation inhibitor Maf [Thiomicrorhabdus sp. 6S3-12]
MQDTHGLSTSHSQTNPESNGLPPVILGSTSIFRQQMLEKLHLPFDTDKPEVDETPLQGEQPEAMVARLSLAKAQAVARKHSDALVIGSDQCAVFDNRPIGKPHTFAAAQQQLRQFSGQSITFYTGLVVINGRTGKIYQKMDTTVVHFRELSDNVIDNYLTIEQPLNCAGSFKSEGLGVTLFQRIDSRDPNALIGLPLMDLTDIFYQMGYPLPLEP